MDLDWKHVDSATWRDFESLFEGRGGPSYCWCMAFRAIAPDAGAAERKAEMRRRVNAGEPIGLVFYGDGDPVGWCSVAPRDSYRGLGGPEAEGETLWSIACLFLRRDLRRRGLTGQMVRAAERAARDGGATMIEATPVDPDSPSYRFMGRVASFRAAGYAEVARAGKRRHVMRKRLVEG